MYAIALIGAKQYKIAEGDEIRVDKLPAVKNKAGDVTLDKVLLYSKGHNTDVGNPFLNNVKVTAEVLGQMKSRKAISFKYLRRKGRHWKRGSRQQLTRLKIKEIAVK